MAEQLQSLLGAQRRLLHDVSHELRSPLARLQMAVGLLQRSTEGADLACRRIEREVERLDALVGEVLTLARLESGRPAGAWQEVDVIGLLASVADDARFEARAQGRGLRFEGHPPALLLWAHGELLLRAFENVVRNAVKFTAEGSTVEIEARADADALRVRVADRGPGLSGAALQRVFEPFVRDESSGRTEGFGLGLAIARRAVEAHGGALSAQHREGGGLVLCFELPLQRALQAAADLA